MLGSSVRFLLMTNMIVFGAIYIFKCHQASVSVHYGKVCNCLSIAVIDIYVD